ncbi:transcription factor RF2b-like [Quillaja saponaria]|uniref:Transcription factor RF2b-like n=1 Tax=Quillaja saponaria TaxID=32244 RepID=A0AAD7LKP6_QUISA|nr:transcription factor RF2b-like [Quillaja saponaria]
MQQPSNPNLNSNPHIVNGNASAPPLHKNQFPPPLANATTTTTTTTSSSSYSIFIRSGGGNGGTHTHTHSQHHHHHRRAHSEVSFRMPDDIMDLSPPDPFNNGWSTAGLEEIGSEDDLFSTYIDVDKLGGGGNGSDQSGNGTEREKCPGANPRHRHSCSVDGSSSTSFGEIMDAKKAMPPDKLAELWTIDPKRAKRILANRQSAARSKERKARYIQELELKVQTLQKEATTLSAQLTLFQRDTNGLSTENTELKLRLQAMEQQAQLRDTLNEALQKEVERLKIATGEILNPSESFNLGMQQVPFTAANFFPCPATSRTCWPPEHAVSAIQSPAVWCFNSSASSIKLPSTDRCNAE